METRDWGRVLLSPAVVGISWGASAAHAAEADQQAGTVQPSSPVELDLKLTGNAADMGTIALPWVLFGVAFLAAVGLATHHRRQLRRIREKARQREREAESRGRASALEALAKAGGTLVWLSDNGRRPLLFGDWQAAFGSERPATSIEDVLARNPTGQDLQASLSVATRDREQWSRVVTMHVEGHDATFQISACPVQTESEVGRTVVGQVVNISDAIASQAQLIAADASRRTMRRYVHYLVREASEPILRLSEQMDLLERKVSPKLPAEDRSMMDAATDIAHGLRRLCLAASNLMSLTAQGGYDDLEPVEVYPFVSDAVQHAQQLHPSAVFEMQCSPGRTVETSPLALRQILDELLLNACKFGSAGEAIQVTGGEIDHEYVLRVTSAGESVAAADLARLGEPFFRPLSSTRKTGPGLGLATAMELARRGRMHMRFSDAPSGNGLCVSVHIPMPA